MNNTVGVDLNTTKEQTSLFHHHRDSLMQRTCLQGEERASFPCCVSCRYQTLVESHCRLSCVLSHVYCIL